MARQKKWNSEAERLAAYRKRSVPEVRGSGELDPDEDPLTPGEREFLVASVQKGTENLIVPNTPGLPMLPIPENPPDLEVYVAEAVAAARVSASARYSDAAWVESAVSSAERYARWRHAGYAAGEISGL